MFNSNDADFTTVGPSTARKDNTLTDRIKAMRAVERNASDKEERAEFMDMLGIKEEWLREEVEDTTTRQRAVPRGLGL